MSAHRASSACFAAIVLGASLASAKGPWPRMTRVLEVSGDPNHLEALTNLGLLTTTDRGKNWTFACNQAFFAQPDDGATDLAVAAGRPLLVYANSGLYVSRDDGCDWAASISSESSGIVTSFAVAPSDPALVMATRLTFLDGGGVERLLVSRDAGATWQAVGAQLPVSFFSLAIDPRDAARLYATGFVDLSDDNQEARFLTSSNGGVDWTTTVVPSTNVWNAPFVAAVHPTDSSQLFLGRDSWTRTGPAVGDDALLYSRDGGATWIELLHPTGPAGGGKLYGFALSPDGSTALAAFGDPVDAQRITDASVLGIYASARDGTYAFEPGPKPILSQSVTCLDWTRAGVYACVSQVARPLGLIFSPDATFSPDSTVELFHRADVRVPPATCRGRAATQCDWSFDCQMVGVCTGDSEGRPPEEDAGPDGGSLDGGSLDEGFPDGASFDASLPDVATTHCDCAIAGRSRPLGARAWIVTLLAGAALGARQRRRS